MFDVCCNLLPIDLFIQFPDYDEGLHYEKRLRGRAQVVGEASYHSLPSRKLLLLLVLAFTSPLPASIPTAHWIPVLALPLSDPPGSPSSDTAHSLPPAVFATVLRK